MERNMNYKRMITTGLLLGCVAVATAQTTEQDLQPLQNAPATFNQSLNERLPGPSASSLQGLPRQPSDKAQSLFSSPDPANSYQQNAPIPSTPALFYKQEPAGTDGGSLQDFSCIEYRGQPLNIHLTADTWSPPKVIVSTGRSIAPVDQSAVPQWLSEIRLSPAGDISWNPSEETSAAPESPNNSLLLLCEDGFKITTAKTLLKSGRTVKLNQFANVKGTVKFAGDTDLNGNTAEVEKEGFDKGQTKFFVVAKWDSIPFHPQLVSQSIQALQEGPGLFCIFTTAEVKFKKQSELKASAILKDPIPDPLPNFSPPPISIQQSEISFETKVPPGRIQFSIMKGDPADTDAWEPTGVSWWETVGQSTAENTVQQLTPPNFELSVVKGQIKQTNKLLEALTTVKQVDGRVEVGQAQLHVMFESVQPTINVTDIRPMEDLLRKAAIWGRPGGSRETSGYQFATSRIDTDGSFTCAIPTTFLRSSVVNILKDRKVLAHDVGRASKNQGTIFERGDDANIFESANNSPLPNGQNQRQLDLREIDLDPYLDGNSGLKTSDTAGNNLDDWEPKSAVADSSFNDDNGMFLNAQPSTSPLPNADNSIVGTLEVADAVLTEPGPQQAASSIDRTIADLVAQLLSSGDRRTRQTMKEPLKKLLEQRFDAEQKAREQLLNELRQRFDKANQQVTERATRRDAIINEQLQRMLSLPEDDFEVLPALDSRDRNSSPGDMNDDLDTPRSFDRNLPTPRTTRQENVGLFDANRKATNSMLDLDGQPILDQRNQKPFAWVYKHRPFLIYAHPTAWKKEDPNTAVLKQLDEAYGKYGFAVIEIAGKKTTGAARVQSDWPVLFLPDEEVMPSELRTDSTFSLHDAKGTRRTESTAIKFETTSKAVEDLLREAAKQRAFGNGSIGTDDLEPNLAPEFNSNLQPAGFQPSGFQSS